ncbi:MAG: hypothetical protein H6Q60_987 [Oscillospiraceae bacterium]|nr:hypothetical protein [Oscillospiraceae bacterium]
MKIIDEKGKIFGKLNIIDLLVLLLAVVLVAFLGIKFIGGGGSGTAAVPALITYTVEVRGVDPEVYDSICDYVNLDQNQKDQLMSDGELISNAYIINVTATDYVPYVEDALKAGGADDDRLTLVFTIQAQVSDATTDKVGSQEVRIGKTHIVKTTHFELTDGIIQTCVWDEDSGN